MNLKELLTRLGVVDYKTTICKPDDEIFLMAEESDPYDIKSVLRFEDGEVWFCFDVEGAGDDAMDWEEGPLCEREGDMCSLPEIADEARPDPLETSRGAKRA